MVKARDQIYLTHDRNRNGTTSKMDATPCYGPSTKIDVEVDCIYGELDTLRTNEHVLSLDNLMIGTFASWFEAVLLEACLRAAISSGDNYIVAQPPGWE